MADQACRLSEAVVDRDRCVILENRSTRIAINADHGCHLYELTDLRSGTNLLHQDALGSRHYRVGAWYELFPNAGAACTVDGHELSQHGDIQRRPWTYQPRIATADLIEVEFASASREMPFGIVKTVTISAASAGVHLSETITNTSDRALPYLWGQHITLGEPFMTASSRIDLPDIEVYARADTSLATATPYAPGARGPLHALPGREGGTVDLTALPAGPFSTMLFAEPLPAHWYNVWADDLPAGLAVAWDGAAFPALWIWATRNGNVRDPSVVACALEPQSCEVPTLAAAIAAGRAPTLGPGQSRSAWVRAILHHDPARVTGVAADGTIDHGG